jgi:hypothetical protein
VPGIEQLGSLAKTYGFTLGFMIAVMLALCYVIRVLWAENQARNSKMVELLDARGKFLDSILNEAINGDHTKRVT